MEVEQEKVFKSNIEEAMTYDGELILKNAVVDFLKNKLEKAIMDASEDEVKKLYYSLVNTWGEHAEVRTE